MRLRPFFLLVLIPAFLFSFRIAGTEGIELGGELAGWQLIGDPYPDDKSFDAGTIVFKVYANAEGRVQQVDVVESSGISPATLKLYQKTVYKLAFVPPPGKISPTKGIQGTVRYEINVR